MTVKLDEQHVELLQIVQEVLRGMTVSLARLSPNAAPAFAAALQQQAHDGGYGPTAVQLLEDLAAGLELFDATQRLKTPDHPH